jgi:predicted DNA-binding transcriptional regulator YafY
VTGTAGRLLRLLALLQRRPSWTGQDLADRLGVDARTVRRDVERIRELGYVVDSTPGTAGGYRLGVGADMPPLLLDEDEAMAVAVLLGVSAAVAVPGIESAALAMLARVDRLLPPRLQRQVKALRAATVPLMGPVDAVPAKHLARLAQACDANELVSFDYRSRDGRNSSRRAEPYRLVATDRLWYLVAYDLDRLDWRTFRVDRVKQVRLTGHTFEPRPLGDPRRLVSDAITSSGYRYQALVRFEATTEEVRRKVPPHVGAVEAGEDGPVLRIGVDQADWLTGYLVGLALPFEVVGPPELRERARAIAQQMLNSHSAL